MGFSSDRPFSLSLPKTSPFTRFLAASQENTINSLLSLQESLPTGQCYLVPRPSAPATQAQQCSRHSSASAGGEQEHYSCIINYILLSVRCMAELELLRLLCGG